MDDFYRVEVAGIRTIGLLCLHWGFVCHLCLGWRRAVVSQRTRGWVLERGGGVLRGEHPRLERVVVLSKESLV